MRDPEGEVQTVKGQPEPDADLRDFENVPLDEDVDEYLTREVLPQGYCVLVGLVTALMRSLGRRLARLVARAMLVSPLLRW